MLNVHPSLLPRWRGAAPIERAIMAGDELTGIDLEDASDQQDVAQRRVAFAAFDTAQVGPVHPGLLGEDLEREVEFVTAIADTPTEGLRGGKRG